MHTHGEHSALHVVLVGYEHLAEVVGLAGFLEYLALKERQGGVCPAGSRTILVLDAGYGKLLDGCEHGLAAVGRVLFLLSLHANSRCG